MKWTGTHDARALSDSLRKALKGRRGLCEKRMFGGVCFLLRDHMLCGAGREGFMFRVGKAQHAAAARRKGATPVEKNGRRMEGFFWVDPRRCTAAGLGAWIRMADKYVATLAPKGK